LRYNTKANSTKLKLKRQTRLSANLTFHHSLSTECLLAMRCSRLTGQRTVEMQHCT